MERILETHQFGSHRVVVLEHAGDDETTYTVLVDNTPAIDSPLPYPLISKTSCASTREQ
jgi:hypothetical protein